MTFIISWIEIGAEKSQRETALPAWPAVALKKKKKKSLVLWDFKANKIYEQALDVKWNSWQSALVYKNKR